VGRGFVPWNVISKTAVKIEIANPAGKPSQFIVAQFLGEQMLLENFVVKLAITIFLDTRGINGRGSRWKKIRNETCRRSPFCALCGTIHRLDVHHIIPFRLTRDNRQINLVPLCKKHHKQVEGTFLHLENTGIDLETLHLWFCSTLLQWQNASRFVLKRLHQDLS
jgi:hypothetical protein